MQRTKTAAKLAALAAVGVLVLGACGSDSDGGSEPKDNGTDTEATTTTAADGEASTATPPR